MWKYQYKLIKFNPFLKQNETIIIYSNNENIISNKKNILLIRK